MTLGSVRHHVRIDRSAVDVWSLVGDPSRLHEWFPGIVACSVDGNVRVITTGTGLPLSEEILIVDGLQRRFQYQITAPIFRYHRGTLDVLDLGDGTCVVSYATDADPRSMALTIAGATAGALDRLKSLMEGTAMEMVG